MLFRGDRLEARDDWNGDSSLAAFCLEVIEDLVVKKHLGDDVISSGVHFLLEVENVGAEVGSLGVLLRVGGNSDAEISSALPSNSRIPSTSSLA